MLCTAQELSTYSQTLQGRNDIVNGIISSSQLARTALVNSIGFCGTLHNDNYDPNWDPLEPLSVDQADSFLGALADVYGSGYMMYGKALRPWDISPTESRLDPTKAWLGWEIETGWETDTARRLVATEVLGSDYRACLDEEGPAYGLEITFMPLDGSETGTHPLDFVAELASEYEAYQHDSDSDTGTHINFSTPDYRAATTAVQRNVVGAINHAIKSLTYAQRETLFGRSRLYAGAFARDDSRDNNWVELKTFNTTYDYAVAKGYREVANNIVKFADIIIARMSRDESISITNAFGVFLNGDDPVFSQELFFSKYPLTDGYEIVEHYDDDDYDSDWCCDDEDCDECY